MHHISNRLLIAVACAALYVAGARTASADDQQARAIQDIETFIDRVMATGMTPGLAVGIVRGPDVIYTRGFGFADQETGRRATPDTLFYIASTTKSFTALAAALLDARHEIDLNSPVSTYLPNARWHPSVNPELVTLAALLTHTHGLRPGGPIDIRSAFTGEFTNAQLLSLLRFHETAPMGRTFTYSNLGYNIFGLVLDQKYTHGWKQVLQREVFTPLGMRSTTAWMTKADQRRLALPYELRSGRPERVPYAKVDETMHAAGGHVSSVADLVRYLQAHLNNGRIGDRQALSAEAIDATHRPLVSQERTFGPFQRTGWSLGWDVATYEGDDILQRFGDFLGFRSHVSFMPNRRIGVVVLSNGGGASSPLTDVIATYIYDRLANKPGLSGTYEERLAAHRQQLERLQADATKRQMRPQVTPLPWEAYVGAYESEALGRMVWKLENGRLAVQLGLARGDVEVYDGDRFQLRVTLTGAGSVATFAVPFGADRPSAVEWMNVTFTRVAE